jgi:hypothetical protein
MIMDSSVHALEYCPNLGPITTTLPASMLYMTYLSYGNSHIRYPGDQELTLMSPLTVTFTSMWITL